MGVELNSPSRGDSFLLSTPLDRPVRMRWRFDWVTTVHAEVAATQMSREAWWCTIARISALYSAHDVRSTRVSKCDGKVDF